MLFVSAMARRGAARRRALAFGGAALVWLASLPAAASERQWRIGGGAGVAALRGSTAGPAIDGHAAYGLSDLFDVHLELLGSRHFKGEDTTVFSASAGLSYKVDVFQWVPYVGLFGGYYWYGGRPGPNGESGHEAGASIGAGLDYLISRELSLGAQIREHASFTDGLSFPYFNASLRAEYRWGY